MAWLLDRSMHCQPEEQPTLQDCEVWRPLRRLRSEDDKDWLGPNRCQQRWQLLWLRQLLVPLLVKQLKMQVRGRAMCRRER